LEQVNILTVKGMPTEFKLVYINIPSLHPGEISELTFKIENTDTVSHTLNITADLPTGWGIEPEIIEVIEARQTKELKLYLSLPSDAITGTYIIRIFFTWDEDIIMREYSVSVQPYISLVVYILIFVITGLSVIIITCLLWKRYKKEKLRVLMIEKLKQERRRLGWEKK